MKRQDIKNLLCEVMIVAAVLSGCSIEINQPAPNGVSLQPADQPQKKIRMIWKNMGLQGRLVYISSSFGSENGSVSILFHVEVLDLASGSLTSVFHAPAGDLVEFLSASPDGKQIVMQYLRAGDNVGSGSKQELLYSMPLDGSQSPRLLLPPPSSSDLYYQPTWSPDGRYIYFSHVNLKASSLAGQTFPDYELSRLAYPAGLPVKLMDHAFWPRLSPDGSYLTYVSVDPRDGSNRLLVANSDASAAHQIVLTGPYVPRIIDAPFFSADNRSVCFGAASPITSFAPNWAERILGITVASAHIVPSDLWCVSIHGGTPTQVTHLAALGLYATPAPDGRHIALYTGRAVAVMDRDGSNLTALVNVTGGIPGSVSWLP